MPAPVSQERVAVVRVPTGGATDLDAARTYYQRSQHGALVIVGRVRIQYRQTNRQENLNTVRCVKQHTWSFMDPEGCLEGPVAVHSGSWNPLVFALLRVPCDPSTRVCVLPSKGTTRYRRGLHQWRIPRSTCI